MNHRITTTLALALALAATAAPAASADPAPLAQAEAAALTHPTRTPASAASCGDVCSSYGLANVSTHTPASTAPRSNVVSGSGYGSISKPVALSSGFDWGDAGIGAGGAFALTMIGLGGVLTATNRRGTTPHHRRANANS